MRPMSVREIDALCYERGIEFDPAPAPAELAEMATMVTGQPRGTASRLRSCQSGASESGCPSGSRPRTCWSSRGSAKRSRWRDGRRLARAVPDGIGAAAGYVICTMGLLLGMSALA